MTFNSPVSQVNVDQTVQVQVEQLHTAMAELETLIVTGKATFQGEIDAPVLDKRITALEKQNSAAAVAITPAAGWSLGGSGFSSPVLRVTGNRIDVLGGRIAKTNTALSAAPQTNVIIATGLPASDIQAKMFAHGSCGTVQVDFWVTTAGALVMYPLSGLAVAVNDSIRLPSGFYYI